MKKILSCLVLAGVMAMSIGCGGSPTSAPTPPVNKPTPPNPMGDPTKPKTGP